MPAKNTTGRTTHLEHENRLERIERLLARGKSQNEIVRMLCDKPPNGYSVSTATAKLYIAEVHERWADQATENSLRRRERYLRMAEGIFSKAEEEGKYSAAVSALNLAAQISGVFNVVDDSRAKVLDDVGPVPSDPAQIPTFVQRVLILNMIHVIGDPQMDASTRHRILTDYSSKLVQSQPKALAGARIEDLERQVAILAPSDPSQLRDGETEEALLALAENLRTMATDLPPAVVINERKS